MRQTFTEYTRSVLKITIERLAVMQNYHGQNDTGSDTISYPLGICSNIPSDIPKRYLQSWPHFSGNVSYPIDVEMGHGQPHMAYQVAQLNGQLWADTPYGDLRRNLAGHLLKCFRLDMHEDNMKRQLVRKRKSLIKQDMTQLKYLSTLTMVSNDGTGVCNRLWCCVPKEFTRSYKEFSGETSYPVPHPTIKPREAYYSALAMFGEDTYGDSRRAYAKHLLKCYRKSFREGTWYEDFDMDDHI